MCFWQATPLPDLPLARRYLQQERAEIDYALGMLRQEASPYRQP